MATGSAYLVIATGQVSSCSGSISSYTFPSSSCTGTTCNFTTSITRNAAINVAGQTFGVAGTRDCDGQSHDAIARASNGADVRIGTYACAIGRATLNVGEDCRSPQRDRIVPESSERNCDIYLYSTSVPSTTPCTEMIACDANSINCQSFLGQRYSCDSTLRTDQSGTRYICDCLKQVSLPIPADPAVFPNGTPRSGGCGLPLVAQAFPSSLASASSSGASRAASSGSSSASGLLASLSASVSSASAASASLSSESSIIAIGASSASLASSSLSSAQSISPSASSSLLSASSSLASSTSSLSSASSALSSSFSSLAGVVTSLFSQSSELSSSSTQAQSSLASLSSSLSAAAVLGVASAISTASTAYSSLPPGANAIASSSYIQAQASHLASVSSVAAQSYASLASESLAAAIAQQNAAANGSEGGGGTNNTGAIVGGVIGGLAGLLLLLALLWFLISRSGRGRGSVGPYDGNGYARTSTSGVYDPRVEEDGLMGEGDRPLTYAERPSERGPLLAR